MNKPDSHPVDQGGLFAGMWDEVVATFGAVRFAVGLLIAWAAVSILGTVVPQLSSPPTAEARRMLAETFIHRSGEFWADVIMYLRLYDVYHAPWYQLILVLLTLSVMVCTVERSRASLKRFFRPNVRLPRVSLEGMEVTVRRTAPVAVEAVVRHIRKFFPRHGFRVFSASANGVTDFYIRRGGLSTLGPLVTHIGVLVIFLGAVYGRNPIFGAIKYMAPVDEGEFYREANTDSFIRLTNFRIDYDDHWMEKDFTSTVEVYERTPLERAEQTVEVIELGPAPNDPWQEDRPDIVIPVAAPGDGTAQPHFGRLVGLRKTGTVKVRVNHPIHQGGIKYYQASWGVARANVRVTDPAGKAATLSFSLDEKPDPRIQREYIPAAIPQRVEIGPTPGLEVIVVAFATNVETKEEKYTNQALVHPAALLYVRTKPGEGMLGGFQRLGWVAEDEEQSFEGYRFSLERPTLRSVFDVRRDPGWAAVLLGFIGLVLGLVLTFYIPLRVIRAQVVQREKKTEVFLAAPRMEGADKVQRLMEAFVESGWAQAGEREHEKIPDRHS